MRPLRKIYIALTDIERTALIELARRERRDVRAQGALLIRQALEREGLLQPLSLDTKKEDSEDK